MEENKREAGMMSFSPDNESKTSVECELSCSQHPFCEAWAFGDAEKICYIQVSHEISRLVVRALIYWFRIPFSHIRSAGWPSC